MSVLEAEMQEIEKMIVSSLKRDQKYRLGIDEWMHA